MDGATDLLSRQLAEAYERLRQRVEGLSDEEFFWEPGPGAWTVHPDDRGRWFGDYEEPDPDPPPITTIGWRLVHVLECKLMYDEYAFGDGRLTWDRLDSPHTAATAIAALEHHHARLARSVSSLHDADLDRPVLTNWGEKWPAWKIVWTMIHHDLWHGGEIGALRDLFRATR
jgi:hypothetical protein